MSPVHKATITTRVGDDLEFILSDESVDRLDDMIESAGWDVAAFNKNPIALFGHRGDFPIGKWANVRVVNKELRGNLILADEGTSPRIDEIRKLIEQQILRAVSVGFRPIERKPREESKRGGIVFTKSELLEASLVSVPANPNALHVAKSLNISRDTLAMIFGESAIESERGSTGESAETPPVRRTGIMPTIAERIEAAQTAFVAVRTELEAHLAGLDNDNVTDAQMARTNELNATLRGRKSVLDALKESEILIGGSASPARPAGAVIEAGASRGVWAAPAKKIEPRDYIFRAFAVLTKHHGEKGRIPVHDIMRQGYGEDAILKGFLDVVTRAQASPADTVTTAWAAVLVQTAIGEFFDALMPQSVYPGLSAKGGKYTFGRNGSISLPTRNTTPTIAGSFFAQGSPIPVRQGAFSAVTLVPKKMGVITTMTREIQEHSIPAIEGLLRQAIQEDTAKAIDTVLLDNVAADAIRPAGILNGVTVTAGTAGGGLAAIVTDVKSMLGALITATAGNIRNPVWLMHPVQVLALQLTTNGNGEFPFKAEVNAGTFQGYPLLQSTVLTAGTVILVDAADFFSATGDEPRFDVSDQATLHMEDTTPLPIVGGPNQAGAVPAWPTRSLWQTDCIGIRMILDISWAFRRTGMVVARSGVTW